MWLEGQARLLLDKESQLAARRQKMEKFAVTLRSSLHQQMLDWGVKKVEGNEYWFKVKKNPPRVEIVDEEAIPPEFIGYTPTVNKAAIKSALEDGKQVPGAELVQTTRLGIR
jgi:hypothetical protein